LLQIINYYSSVIFDYTRFYTNTRKHYPHVCNKVFGISLCALKKTLIEDGSVAENIWEILVNFCALIIIVAQFTLNDVKSVGTFKIENKNTEICPKKLAIKEKRKLFYYVIFDIGTFLLLFLENRYRKISSRSHLM